MLRHPLQGFLEAYPGKDLAVRLGVPLLGCIQNTKLQRVHTQLFGNDIHVGFHGKVGLRCRRRTVIGGRYLVGQHILCVDGHVGDPVLTQDIACCKHTVGHLRIGAGIIDQRCRGGRNQTIPGHAHLDGDDGFGSRPAVPDCLVPGHLHPDRPSGYHGKQPAKGRHRLIGFTPEGAADLHGNQFHPACGQIQEVCDHLLRREEPLAMGPEGQFSAFIHGRHGREGLDKTMMHLLGMVCVFQDKIGIIESGLYIALFDLEVIGNIAGLVIPAGQGPGNDIGPQDIMNQW